MADRLGNPRDRRDVVRRFMALSERDRLEVFTELREYLGEDAGVESESDHLVAGRREALEALSQVTDHLRAKGQLQSGKAPTADQFDSCARELDLDWSRSRVVRAFGTWRNAKNAVLGGEVREGPAQRRRRSRSSSRARHREDYLAALREWLAAPDSPGRDRADYEAFCESRDRGRAPGTLRLPSAAAIVVGLRVNWQQAVAVAEDTIELQDARQARAEQSLGDLRDDALIGSAGIEALLGRNKTDITSLLNVEDFPRPVARFGRTYAWFVGDLKRYAVGDPVPTRRDGEYQAAVMGARELAKALGMNHGSMLTALSRGRKTVPRPDGKVGSNHYWLRENVERWKADRLKATGVDRIDG